LRGGGGVITSGDWRGKHNSLSCFIENRTRARRDSNNRTAICRIYVASIVGESRIVGEPDESSEGGVTWCNLEASLSGVPG